MSPVKLPDGRQMHLGRIRPYAVGDVGRFRVIVTQDGLHRLVPRLGAYYNSGYSMVQTPTQVDWTLKAMASIIRVYLNDTYGDCVIASKYHVEGVASANDTGTATLATDAEVLNSYHTICGPGDNGCVITDVLDYWQKNGLIFTGVNKKIDGYVAIDWTNKDEVKVALALFPGITLGINLPSNWTCTNCVWGAGGGNVGGHDVPALAFRDGGTGPQLKDANGKDFAQDGVIIATWGGLVLIPWAQFLSKSAIEEAYVALPQDWYQAGNLAPNGVDVATLKSDLQMLGGGQLPPLPPGPMPPTPLNWIP